LRALDSCRIKGSACSIEKPAVAQPLIDANFKCFEITLRFRALKAVVGCDIASQAKARIADDLGFAAAGVRQPDVLDGKVNFFVRETGADR